MLDQKKHQCYITITIYLDYEQSQDLPRKIIEEAFILLRKLRRV